MLPFVVWTVAWLGLLLLAERNGSRWGIWLAKPLASAGFVAAALRSGLPGSDLGWWLATGLALSWLGDVLLIPAAAPRAFGAGMAAFGAAHLAYLLGFATRGLDAAATALAAAVLALLAWVTLRWLWPQLDAVWRTPVAAYVAVITCMVALAGGSVAAGGPPLLLAGAACFAVSDLAVARDRFVKPAFANALWGLPLYYGAQLMLASALS